MPRHETRESIEAELNAGERQRFTDGLKATIRDFDDLERQLREIEWACGIVSSRSKPLDERLEAVGLERAAAATREALNAMTKAVLGEIDEIPEHLERELVERADAEISALDQLRDILNP